MEDHREAYLFWKELGVRQAVCVHVDAHLDTCGFKVPGYTGLRQPEVNCGNFLLPAMDEELVSELVWVIPPHLVDGQDRLEWARNELQNWLRPTVSDYLSLQLVEGRVEGQLLGKRLVICTSDNLPKLAGPLVLDIDIDYFLAPGDGLWQDPLQLHHQLGQLKWQALTVAYSVQGGYTPLEQRYLGDLTVLTFTDRKSAEALSARLGEVGQDLPDWMRAAGYWRRGEAERAAKLDPGCVDRAIDRVCGLLDRGRFEQCPPWLERLQSEDRTAAIYLEGYLAFRLERYVDAIAAWQGLLEHETDRLTQRHLLEMIGLAQRVSGQAAAAVKTFTQATRLDGNDASLWLQLARSQVEAGEDQRAARSYRRALTLAPELLDTQLAQLELAQLYLAQGQVSQARAQCARILQVPAPRALKLQAEVLKLKATTRKHDGSKTSQSQ